MSRENIEPKGVAGGKARAAKLTKAERAEMASRMAQARWNRDLPLAPFTGDIKIGNKEIPCAVLEDGSRLISTAGILHALDRPWRGTYKTLDRTETPNFLGAKNLVPFISSELRAVLTPVKYRIESGSAREGYPASILRLVCNVYLNARRAGELKSGQEPIAVACEIVLDALAETGIAALIDEATGYQDHRAKDALAKILEEFISKELQPWTRTFPVDFYKEIFRLNRWPFDPGSVKRPGVIGHWTNDIVYSRLAPNVLQELRAKNPKVDGKRKHKLFQWLTGEVGHPKLMAHLEGVKVLMKLSDNWDDFMERIDKVYKVFETTELGFDVERTKRKKL